MKKLRVWSWLISGFLKRHKKIILLGSSLGVSLAIFIIWVLPYIPRPNLEQRIGIVGQYRRNQLPEFITLKVSQGLTAILSDGSAAPALAQSWELSEDGKTYTFHLRENLYWQDGTPVTADTIQYSFSDVEQTVVDNNTIIFVLKDAYAPFPTLVSEPVFKDGTIGTGEYVIKRIQEKMGYVEKIVLEGKKDTIIVKFYPSLKTATVAFSLGEIDQLKDVFRNPFDNNSPWINAVTVTETQDQNSYLALFINNNSPNLKDKTFRQALAYATKKPTDSNRSLSPISMTSWAYNPNVKPYDYDPARAAELIEKSLGSNDRVKEMTIKLATTQTFLSTAEMIKQDWESALGIRVDVEVINSLPNDYEVLLSSESMPSDPDQYSLWHSTQPQNFINFKSPRIDKILEDARREPDQEKRKELYYDFQRFFVEESPIIFISYPPKYSITRKSVIKPVTNAIIRFGRD